MSPRLTHQVSGFSFLEAGGDVGGDGDAAAGRGDFLSNAVGCRAEQIAVRVRLNSSWAQASQLPKS